MSIEEGSYGSGYSRISTPMMPLYDFSTIILKPKKKRFKTYWEALRYMTVDKKRNITKECRFHPFVRRPIYMANRLEVLNKLIRRNAKCHISFCEEEMEERFLLTLFNRCNLKVGKRAVRGREHFADELIIDVSYGDEAKGILFGFTQNSEHSRFIGAVNN